MADRFDIAELTRNTALVATTATSHDLFSFITREVMVPVSSVALAFAEGGLPRVVSGGRPIASDGVHDVLFVRCVPFELKYEYPGLRSKDGYDFKATLGVSVGVVPDRVELEAFRREVLGSQRTVTTDRLRQFCEETVRNTLTAFVASRTAADLCAAGAGEAYDAELEEAFKQLGFRSGLSLGPDPRLVLSSPGFLESQREQRASALAAARADEDRRRQQAAVEARKQHIAELGEMLTQVRSMAGDAGGVKVAELIRTFDAGQRGKLYEHLMGVDAPARRTAAILVVAGSNLLWFDPLSPREPARKLRLPEAAGALRSVRIVDDRGIRRILVGARLGVHVLDASGDVERTLTFPDKPELRGGVNAATLLNGRVFATHSEVGLLQWPLDGSGPVEACLSALTEGAHAVRDIQTDAAGRLWLAIDDLIVGWSPSREASESALSASAEITSLVVADGYAYAGLKNGAIVRWLIGGPRELETVRQHTGGPVRSIAWMAGGGVPRLLIGDDRPQLELLVLGDSYQGAYRSLHNLRWGFASDDFVVGVNDRRDHIFCWRPDDPTLPVTSIAVSRLTGRSIQDLALWEEAPSSATAHSTGTSSTLSTAEPSATS